MMQEGGGEAKRREIERSISKGGELSSQMGGLTIGGAVYNDEEAKVAMHGDKGQGERLTEAKAAAQKRRK